MDFSQLVKKRRACHHFIPRKKIPREDLVKIIEETSYTPSGYNAQPWEFIIIDEKEKIEQLQEIAFNQTHVRDASVIIVVLGDIEIGRNVDELLQDWVRLGYCTEDEVPIFKNSIAKNRMPFRKEKMALRNSMLACMTLMFSAENMGYNTCPMMGVSQKDLIDFLQIPEDRIISLFIAIGQADLSKENEQLPRKKPETMIHWGKFGGKLK